MIEELETQMKIIKWIKDEDQIFFLVFQFLFIEI